MDQKINGEIEKINRLFQWQAAPHFYIRRIQFYFLLVSWSGVRLNPFGTSATNWRIVPGPNDR
jgi:hypothetical protein